ncbi:hypothetical protein ACE1TI_18600 [Alteribacillus sp. JSM 102045]|uniref:hypothetical protein n=1 Tax=Alteribacillus sp. JSM 102045 TaxID=1562101 RepID=UPI0035C07774
MKGILLKRTKLLTVIISGIITLMLIALIIPKYEQMLDFYNVKWILIYSIILSMLYFIFGMLIETKRLIKVFSKKLSVNWLHISFVILLLLIIFIPVPYWLLLLPNNFFLLNFIFVNEVQVILNILAGILFVRAFENNS